MAVQDGGTSLTVRAAGAALAVLILRVRARKLSARACKDPSSQQCGALLANTQN